MDVQVHSGLPSRLLYKHSKCRIEPGNTASSPPGSIAADPAGTLTNTEGGESSANNNNNNINIHGSRIFIKSKYPLNNLIYYFAGVTVLFIL